jgi:hypothetical protein
MIRILAATINDDPEREQMGVNLLAAGGKRHGGVLTGAARAAVLEALSEIVDADSAAYDREPGQ